MIQLRPCTSPLVAGIPWKQKGKGEKMSMVWCEKKNHNGQAHEQTRECEWPHYVGPSAPMPIVGHPLTVHD